MQFSAVEIRFVVTTYLYSTFANDLKRKYFFSKNVHSYRVCSFKHLFWVLKRTISDCSFEYPQHMFYLRNKKFKFELHSLSGGMLQITVGFILLERFFMSESFKDYS